MLVRLSQFQETDFYMCMELMDANLDELRKLIYVNGVVPNLPKSKIESFLGCVAVSVRALKIAQFVEK